MWGAKYKQLVVCKVVHGDCNAAFTRGQRGWKEDYKLANWVFDQRKGK
jgi:hypothetical protein